MNNMVENDSLETISLGMFERFEIGAIAERAFKKGVKEVEGLEGADLEYISSRGQEAEKVFYERIQGLENEQKFPKLSKMGSFRVGYIPKKKS